jgi:hypothetical protein
MARLPHGVVITATALQDAQRDLAGRSADVNLGFAAARTVDLQDFDFLFPDLQEDDANLLPESVDTPDRLKQLGRTMEDPGVSNPSSDPGDANIPAVYTYFGQFVDHDITLEVQPADLPPPSSGGMPQLLDPNMTPLSLAEIRNAIRNFRTATLDLDSVYGLPAPRDPNNGNKLKVGKVSPLNGTAPPTMRPPRAGSPGGGRRRE